MRLVVGCPWGARLGGAENILWTYLRHLDRGRVEPIVVFFAEGPFVEEAAALGMRVEILPTRRLRHGGRAIATTRSLRTLLRSERPGAVLGWGPKPQVYLGPAAAFSGLTRRTTWMGTEIPGAAVHRLATALPAAAVGCLSDFIARRQSQLRPRRPTYVVHPGIEPPTRPDPGEVDELRARHRLDGGQPVLGMVGRLVPVKGQDRLIRAAAELKRRGLEPHVLLVGGDEHGFAPEYGPALRRLAAELGLAEAVTFTGQVARAEPYLSLMDVSVSAAPEEGFGIALLEAMALKIPVVAVDAGGPAEIVEHERSGLLAPSDHPSALADAVERVLREPDLRERLAEGGHVRFETCFTAKQMADRLTARLEEIARRAS